MCFYWPSHEQRLMKFICFEMVVIALFSISFMFKQKRNINNIWPGLFLFFAMINMFTHLMQPYTQMAFTFCLFAVMAIYTILRSACLETILIMKKAFVISALINLALFLTQYVGWITVFDKLDQHSRPCGFMCYPAHFSLLCAVSILFAWEWKKWLCIPLTLGVVLCNESSVFLAIFIIFLVSFKKKWWINAFLIFLAILSIALMYVVIHGKFHLRGQFWLPTFRLAWARPLDGFGLGGYRQYFSVIAPNFQKGVWPELHCEPLQLFFEMGLLGIALFYGWINKLIKDFTWNIYSRSMLIILIVSFFHSIFHFCDSLWLIICIYTMWEIERLENSLDG